MQIEFWDCEYSKYDESFNGVEETRYYNCNHPKGNGICTLNNKHGETDDCKLLDGDGVLNDLH